MLFETPRLDGADRQVIEEIEKMRHDLRLHVQPRARWTKHLRRNLTARAIVGSNAIEGYPASVDDVEALMVGEESLETDEAIRSELEGYQRAMTYIQALSDAGDGFRYETGLLNSLHFMMQEHHPDKRPGRFRKGMVYLSSPDDPVIAIYTGPDTDEVGGLMEELVSWLNEGDLDAPVAVRASMAHLNLVNIHPWADGNGRMSRALSTLVFSREALIPAEFSSIEEWLGRGQNTYAYYEILKRTGGAHWSPDGDAHPWIRFCLRAHHLQAQQAKRRVDLISRAWGMLTEVVALAGLDERVIFALLPAFWGSKVRRAIYQQDAELSTQQSTRDIRDLCRFGWLTAQGQARGRYYVAGPAMQQVLDAVKSSTEPFREPY